MRKWFCDKCGKELKHPSFLTIEHKAKNYILIYRTVHKQLCDDCLDKFIRVMVEFNFSFLDD